MKNRLFSFILTICLLIPCMFALSACGKTPGGSNKDPNSDSPTNAVAVRDLDIIAVSAGDGRAIFVKLPDGKSMLIDAGDSSIQSYTAVDDLILRNAKRESIMHPFEVDYLVLTNTYQANTGNIAHVFDSYEVKNFFRPDVKSGHADAASLSSEYNYGTADLIDPSKEYAEALVYASNESGCVIKTINETSCDIDCTFKDKQGNTHNYKIDFLLPLANEVRDGIFDNTAMIVIEYNDVTTLITSDATTTLIDTYCEVYGTKYDVDVLITSYLYTTGAAVQELNYAISRSDLRETNFLEKINLEFGEWAIVTCPEISTDISDLYEDITDLIGIYTEHDGEHHYFVTQTWFDNAYIWVGAKIAHSGGLTVKGTNDYDI